MRAWLWTVLTIALAVVVAFLIHRFPGNVLVVVHQWRVQVSLAFATLALLALFAALYLAVRVLGWLVAVPGRYRGWRGQRRERQEQSLLEQGWTGLLEGRYSYAEKALTRLSGQSGNVQRRVLAMLSAARAAQELGEFARRDEMINSARTLAAGEAGDIGLNTAVAAAAAELWLQQGQASQALEVLQAGNVEAARHLHTMRLLMMAHQQLGDHARVLELARTLRRKEAISAQQAERLLEQAACGELRRLQPDGDWQSFWKSLRGEEKLLPEVALAGSAALQAAGELKEASKVLEAAIKVGFDPRLLAAYARAEPEQVTPRLQRAEQWLTERDKDPDLLATLGALCLAAQMWGQAQRYLERSVQLRGDARVHALLGSLFDRIGQSQRAARHWRLATAVSAALPTLAQDVVLPAAEVEADPVIRQTEGLGDDPAIDAAPNVVSADQRGRGGSDEEFFDSAPIPLHHFESIDDASIVRSAIPGADSAAPVAPVKADSEHSQSPTAVTGRGHLS